MQEPGFRLSTPARRVVPAAAPNPEEEQVNRRGFMADSAGAVLSLIPLHSPPDGASPSRIGAVNVRALETVVAKIYAHDHDHGSAAMRRDSSDALHTACSWLQEGTYTEKTGRRLRSATGRLSIAAGRLSYDSGRPAGARSLYNEALAAARIAEDPGLESKGSGSRPSWPTAPNSTP